jgi:hypothetical protein
VTATGVAVGELQLDATTRRDATKLPPQAVAETHSGSMSSRK